MGNSELTVCFVSILPKVASFVITTVLQEHCGRDCKPDFYSAEESERRLKYENQATIYSTLSTIQIFKASSEALN